MATAYRLYIASMSSLERLSRLTALLTVLAVGALVASLAHAQANQMYRYTNNEGNKVIAYQVPPEFVAGGYEILSSTGTLVDVVPRQLDAVERENLNAQEVLEREAKDERERLRKWDESLLLRYSTIDDIEAARERSLRELRIRVSILKGNLRSLKQQVESYQALAADQERFGNVVDAGHLSAMEDLRSEIRVTERAVNDRKDEIAAVDANFDRDVERFSTLIDIVKMRKARGSGG